MAKQTEQESIAADEKWTPEITGVSMDQLVNAPGHEARVSDASIHELAASISAQGLLSPIIVRQMGEPDVPADVRYEIVCGHRRVAACRILGMFEIAAWISRMDDKQAEEARIIENLQRVDVHPLDECDAYVRLLKAGKGGAGSIARSVGKTEAYVYDRLKFSNLIDPFKKAFREGKLTAGHAVLLARLSPADQRKADRDDRALWEEEFGLYGKGMHARTINELKSWIDEHVRFDAQQADGFLFPDTVAKVWKASEKKEKVVHVTRDYHLQDDARDGTQRTYCVTSWTRADGEKGSKTCGRSVVGVVVAGEGRGEAFRVCVDKKGCDIHWKAERKAAKARAAGMASGEGSADDRWEKAQKKRDQERDAWHARQARWEKAKPVFLKMVADVVKKEKADGRGLLAHLIFEGRKLSPMPVTAEDVVRQLAMDQLTEFIEEQEGEYTDPLTDKRTMRIFKMLGIDPKVVLDSAAPEQKKEPEAPKPAGRKQ